MNLQLERPLIFFDLETTGTNVMEDRIVEISVVKIMPDGTKEEKTRRVNPERHIPEAATAVQHITDEDVVGEPTFRQIANSMLKFFEGCDIAGFNSNRFDVPLLIEEFNRAGLAFPTAGRRFIDVQNIFHKLEQRTLVAAYRFYCGKELEDAHSANADTMATFEVLEAQIAKYDQLQGDVKSLSEFSNVDGAVDLQARVVRDANGVPVFNFGKHKGKSVKMVFEREPSYYNWLMQGEFPKNTKDVFTAIKNQR